MMLIILLIKRNSYIVYSVQQRPLQCCERKPVSLKLIIFGDWFQNQVKFTDTTLTAHPPLPPPKCILHLTFKKLIQLTKEHSCYNSSQTALLVLTELVTCLHYPGFLY